MRVGGTLDETLGSRSLTWGKGETFSRKGFVVFSPAIRFCPLLSLSAVAVQEKSTQAGRRTNFSWGLSGEKSFGRDSSWSRG